MKIYTLLHKLGLKKSYVLKFLSIAFIGIHVPLIGLIIFLLIVPAQTLDIYLTLGVVLGATLLATILTLYILKGLLAPMKLADKALKEYRSNREIISVPTEYPDEAGMLLKNIHSTLYDIEAFAEERENLISLITHDIRNHISGMSGMANLIQMETSKDDVDEYANLIIQKGEESINFITETLNLLEAETFLLDQEDFERIQLKPFVSKQVEKTKSSHLDKNVDFQIEIEDDDKINAHPIFFSQILQNLISNAIKFSNENGHIQITGEKNSDDYRLQIKDEGVGFEPENSETIFDKFTKERQTGTENEPTVGLGLYLTKMLVEKHGAKIKASSKGSNQGAVFTITM